MAKIYWFLGTALVVGLAACSSSTSTTGGAATGGAGSIGVGTGGTSSNGTGGTSNATATQIIGGVCTDTFSACGGDPTGTWKYSELCFEQDMTQAYNDYEEQEYGSACKNLIQSVVITTSGTRTFSAGTVTYDTTSTNSMERIYTSACNTAMAGSTRTVNSDFCSTFEAALNNQSGTTATCAFDGTDCTCAQTVISTSTGSDTYTVSGNSLVWSDGTTAECCIQGDSFIEQYPTDFGFNFRMGAVKQ